MAASLSVKPGLEDMEALFWGPSFLTADPPGSFLDEDEEETLAEGAPSPLSSSSYADTFSSSPLSSLSPPSSPPSLLGCKAGADLLPLPWLSADELLDAHVSAADGKGDAFSGMDWMAEKMDLSEFDLESFMGSCDSDESPSSPEDLIASLESDMDLDPLHLSSPDTLLFHPSAPHEELNITLPDLPTLPLPESHAELEMKSEPPSPVPSPSLLPPPSPTFTLDLGSEVDVSESEKAQVPRIVLSLSPPKIVLLLAPKEEPPCSTTTGASSSEVSSDSDAGYVSNSPQHHPCSTPQLSPSTGSSRTKPYSTPSKARPAQEPPAMTGKVKSASDGGTPKVVEKKLKKMEQNKTAATRYRQKKRAEQEALSSECAELERKNCELVEKAESISKEIQYLTDLIEEVRKAKSRKNKVAP